jgi:hypothetical protein
VGEKAYIYLSPFIYLFSGAWTNELYSLLLPLSIKSVKFIHAELCLHFILFHFYIIVLKLSDSLGTVKKKP